ncbi:MAG: pentapeptide repeat-containing protein [Alphaproteobacteria bacterium]|nr:pentapeptide repeat-containing protein [Alphaproteobacteria bacterium]
MPESDILNHELTWSLAQRSEPPLGWDKKLRQHKVFVEELRRRTGHPGEGRWQVLVAGGLPLGLWQGEKIGKGEQLELRLANLSGLDLRRSLLAWANLCGTWAQKQDFSGADLSGALLTDSDLSGCDFTGADLRRADLSRCDLRGARFKGANLDGADLERCWLEDADFSGAKLGKALLTGARGLKR